MGLSVVKHLAEQGWNVMIVDYNEESGQKVARELGDKVSFTNADVSDYDQQAKAFVETWKQWSRLDFVFANAVSTAFYVFLCCDSLRFFSHFC